MSSHDQQEWIQEFNSPSRYLNYDQTISVISLRRNERLQVLQRLFPDLGENARILELGAGTGIVTQMLVDRYPCTRIVAVDGAEGMMEVAKKKLPLANNSRIDWMLSDLSNNHWKDPLSGKFEFILAVDALHHLDHSRKNELYLEIFDLLAPGGTFLISDHMTSLNSENQDSQYDLWIEELHDNILSVKSRPEICNLLDRDLLRIAQSGEVENRSGLKQRLTAMLNSEGENPLPVKLHIDWLSSAGFSEVEVQYRFSSFSIISSRKPLKMFHEF